MAEWLASRCSGWPANTREANRSTINHQAIQPSSNLNESNLLVNSQVNSFGIMSCRRAGDLRIREKPIIQRSTIKQSSHQAI
jgi:hypothetical protein